MKVIADGYRDQIGFIPRAKFQETVDAERVIVALVDGSVVGFVVYRHRKTDEQTTLSEICVSKQWQKQGIGKLLVQALEAECRAKLRCWIQLKCPVDLPANYFYEKLGFFLIATEPGKKRSLNVWRLHVMQGT